MLLSLTTAGAFFTEMVLMCSSPLRNCNPLSQLAPPLAFRILHGLAKLSRQVPEEAVARECMEESGIAISSCRYMQSQPWPYPYSLMIGFVCKASSLDIQVRMTSPSILADAAADAATLPPPPAHHPAPLPTS